MANAKKISIIGGSALLLVAVVAAVAVITFNHKTVNKSTFPANGNPGGVSTSVKAIKEFCEPTDYKKTCETTLTKAAGDKTDMKSLIIASFRANVEHLKEAASRSTILVNAEKDPEAASYLKGCETYFQYAMQDLEEAVKNIEGYEIKDMWKALYDVQMYLGAATRYQEECLDDFKNASSPAAVAMKNALNTSTELTSNALAIVDKLFKVAETFNLQSILGGGDTNRKLLSSVDNDGFPSWVSSMQRKLLQTTNPWELKPVVVVAKDGSAPFKSINQALKTIPRKSTSYVVIYVKEGVYDEQVVIEKDMTHVVMVGDGKTKTKITGKLNVALMKGMTTFKSATIAVLGHNFMAKDIGFENTAGPEGHQAVAARVGSHKSVFYNCQFDGFQDTLYAHSMTQFYRDCSISGTVDFIFGDANSYFQNCNITIRKTVGNKQMSVVTAQGRKDRNENSAIVLDNCHISAEPELLPFLKTNPIYLGRPWKPYARTLIVNSEIDNILDPIGYIPMSTNPMDMETCFYAEVGNHGPGADTSKRVTWTGIKKLDYSRIVEFSVPKFLGIETEDWLTSTGVPVKSSFQ